MARIVPAPLTRLLPLIAAVLATSAVAPGAVSAAPPPGVQNLGLAINGSYTQKQAGRTVGFQVGETQQGNTNLNPNPPGPGNDTDHIDQVLHSYDPDHGGTTNVGLAGGGTANAHLAAGNLVAMSVGEAAQGAADLNGDGDTSDEVIEVYDSATGTTTNMGLARGSSQPALSSSMLLFCASESGQGASGTDLNGDGDTTDDVPFAWRPGDASPTNLSTGNPGLNCIFPQVAGSLGTFGSFERGADLNGDGDTNDKVLFTYRAGDPAPISTGLATAFEQATPDLVAAPVPESSLGAGGADLNNDGDTNDLVMHIIVPGATTPTVTNTHEAATSAIWASGETVAWTVSEAAQKQDLDGDGDQTGATMFTYDRGSGTLTNTHVGVIAAPITDVSGNRVAFGATEQVTGATGTDLNGDGDSTDGSVLQLTDAATGQTNDLGQAFQGSIDLTGQLLAYGVAEQAQGNTDLNGDGDHSDVTLFLRDIAAQTTKNLGVALGAPPVVDGSLIAYGRSETGDEQDLNGDGDQSDPSVVSVYDDVHDLTIPVELAQGNQPLQLRGGLLSFTVSEFQQGAQSRNGDSDAIDNVLAAYDLTDSDGDGLPNSDEGPLGTSASNPDSDGDGLADGQEVYKRGTNPSNPDSDGDGLSDGAEVNTYGSDPKDTDTDNDGLQDGAEVNTYGTSPTNTDSDGDGLSDGAEVNTYDTSPTNPDSDNDSLSDGAEVNTYDSNPNDPDTDHDFLLDGEEVALGTGIRDQDSDGDGLSDGAEVHYFHSNPKNSDTDGDGHTDGFDNCVTVANPSQADSDHDGLGDACDSNPQAPAAPDTTLGGPKKVKRGKPATFRFSSNVTGATFECALDRGGFLPCRSPRKIATGRLGLGSHRLRVRAVGPDGLLDRTPATRSFRVTPPR